MRTCSRCAAEIPAARLEALPNATTCVNCSQAKRKVGYMVSEFSKGTASALTMVNADDPESLRQAHRANVRRR